MEPLAGSLPETAASLSQGAFIMGAVTGDDERPEISGLDPLAAERIVSELGRANGERVLRCLYTAEVMLRSAEVGELNLRWGESAAYNLREALDSVVRGRSAGEGGLSAALSAWATYKITRKLPDADTDAALADLAAALDGLERDEGRHAFMARKLLAWIREQTGVEPLAGANDPTREYNRLRSEAAKSLHREVQAADIQALLTSVVSWFDRFFTPPSALATQVAELAKLPYSAARLDELRGLALNAHLFRLFLSQLSDPRWLAPLRETGLIGPPSPGEHWPASALATDGHLIAGEHVARLLMQILKDLKSLPKADRPSSAFEIMRTASWLSSAGVPVVVEALRRYPTDSWSQTMALSATEPVDNEDEVQYLLSRAIIGNESDHDRGRHTREAVGRLLKGLTPSNVQARFELLVNKLRWMASQDQARFALIDVATLSLAPDEDEREEPMLVVARRLAAALPTMRNLGLAGPEMLRQVSTVSGELGERLSCQAVTGASDVNRGVKVNVLEQRLSSHTATGDDRDLIDDLMPFTDQEIDRLRRAFGQPSTPSPDPDDRVSDDWARAWRWSMVLPDRVLTGWEQAISTVTATYGAPDPSSLDRPTPRFTGGWGSSPISSEALSSMPVLDATATVAGWRPSAEDPWGVSARELARSFETTVKAAPDAWTTDPVAVVRTLREPIYVDHYFRGLAAQAKEIGQRASAIIRAVTLVRQEQWVPAPIGKDTYEFEPDWSVVETVSIELVDALADADADLAGDLDRCWAWAIAVASAVPDDLQTPDGFDDPERFDDPLNSALNTTHGKGLQAVLALGGWEVRNHGVASDRLNDALTRVLAVDGAVGLELRSILAGSRPFVEGIATGWLDEHHDQLFGDRLGRVTFDQTLKYSRPTKKFYERSFDRLLDAARRGAEHAVAWLLIAHLWHEPAYTYDAIVEGLANDAVPLSEACREIARLSTGLPEDQRDLTDRGVAFWDRILAEPSKRVPSAALVGLGYWAMASEVDDARWLELTASTIRRTGGPIDLGSEVAERCRDAQPSAQGLDVLSAILGYGDRWEQSHVESIAVEALRRAVEHHLDDPSVSRLRERLIQRGRHDVPDL